MSPDPDFIFFIDVGITAVRIKRAFAPSAIISQM